MRAQARTRASECDGNQAATCACVRERVCVMGGAGAGGVGKLNRKSCWCGCARVADRLHTKTNGESIGAPWMITCYIEYVKNMSSLKYRLIPYVADRLEKKRRERWCAIDENLFYEFEPVLGEMTLRAKALVLFFLLKSERHSGFI